MAFNYRRISKVTFVGCKGATSTIYANPSSTTTYIRQIWFHVPAGGVPSFSKTSMVLHFAYQVSNGLKSAQVTNQIFAKSSFVTNETYLLDCGVPGLMLTNQNDSLRLWHRSKTTINYCIFGGAE